MRPRAQQFLKVALYVALFSRISMVDASHPACFIAPDPGPCRAFFRRFFWDQESSTCKPFIYGGCDGTVPFRSVSQCEAAQCDSASAPVNPRLKAEEVAVFEHRWWPGTNQRTFEQNSKTRPVRSVTFTAYTRVVWCMLLWWKRFVQFFGTGATTSSFRLMGRSLSATLMVRAHLIGLRYAIASLLLGCTNLGCLSRSVTMRELSSAEQVPIF